MAKATVNVIQTLRNTAKRISKSNDYQWGHMGSCNCGFLAQEITMLKKNEIHAWAMQRHGDWSEQLNDYCQTSGLPMDNLITRILETGFDADDIKHLERLSSKSVLNNLPLEKRNLKHNVKADVALYLITWADMLENKLLAEVKLPEFQAETIPGEAN